MDNIIKCPVCGNFLEYDEKKLVCLNNHSFDKARQGYYNLLLANKSSDKVMGDSYEMLKARQNVFLKGYYSKVSDELNVIVSKYIGVNNNILDIGSGVGYYLDRLEKKFGNMHNYFGVDISKDGVKESSKNNKRIQYLVGTNNKLPFLNDSIDIMISVFSPVYLEECKRVLKTDGHLIVVHPNQDHLIEMKKVIYEDIILKEEKRNELDPLLFTIVDFKNVKYSIKLDGDNIKNLLMMTPHFWTSTLKGKERLYGLNELEVGIDIRIDIYKVNT